MNSRFPLNSALISALLLLTACNDDTTPTQPGTTSDQSLPVPSLLTTASNSWTAKAPVPFGPDELTAAIANNAAGRSILYVFGGHVDKGDGFQVEAYDLSTNTWTAKNSSLSESNTNGVGKIGNKLYITGGAVISNSPLAFGPTWAYDFAADRMIKKADMPLITTGGVTGVISDKLYVLPGVCSGEHFPNPRSCATEPIRVLFRYDPVTNTWGTRAPCPHFHNGAAAAVINGKFYVAGGYNDQGQVTATLDVYTATSNSWKTLANLPEGRVGAHGANLLNKLYSIGGSGASGNRKVYAYDPVTNKWTTKASYPTDRGAGATARVTLDGHDYILAVGGRDSNDQPNATQMYTP